MLDFTLPQQEISIREAVFAPDIQVEVKDAIGRIAGDTVIPCPPGIALVAAGELIDHATAELLIRYGISCVKVLEW